MSEKSKAIKKKLLEKLIGVVKKDDKAKKNSNGSYITPKKDKYKQLDEAFKKGK